MINIEELKFLVVEKLKPLNVSEIILFGSYAYGKPNEDSDVDLYVVTNDEFIPENFQENNQLYLKVSRQIRELRKIVAIDLIVHSKKMNELFKETNSSFFKNDIQRGIHLI